MLTGGWHGNGRFMRTKIDIATWLQIGWQYHRPIVVKESDRDHVGIVAQVLHDKKTKE